MYLNYATTKFTLTTLFIIFGIFHIQSQQVGIGTTSPNGEFHVSAPFNFEGIMFSGSGLNDLTIDYSSYSGLGNTSYKVVISNSGPNPNLFQWSDDDGATWSTELPITGPLVITNDIIIEFIDDFGHTYNDEWSFTIGESYLDGLVVKDSNVGIGTDNPSKKLDVAGDINFTGNLFKSGVMQPYIDNLNGLSDAHHIGTNLVLGAIGIPQGFNNTFIHSIPLNNSGNANVILGSNSGISNSLGITNTFVGAFSGNQNTSGSGNIFLGVNSGYINKLGHNNVYLGTSSGSYNEGSGNVFIGKASGEFENDSSNKLIVANNSLNSLIYGDFDSKYLLINRSNRITGQEIFGIDGNLGGYAGMYINVSGANPSPFYGFAVDGNAKAWFEYNTDEDIVANNNNGNFKVRFNTASKPVAGSWIANSDSRLKKNIKSLDPKEMLAKVLEMRGVSYEWDDDQTNFERPVGKQIGFIAQDLQQIWPEKISEDKQGYLQTAYGDYDPVFVESIKALHEMLGQQAEEIEKLKEKLEELEKMQVQEN